jgi:hypothetical protein
LHDSVQINRSDLIIEQLHGEAITPSHSRESEFVGMGSHRIIMEATSQVDRSASYYDQGSSDLAQETALTEQRLEAVRFPLLGVLVVGGDGDDITKKMLHQFAKTLTNAPLLLFIISAGDLPNPHRGWSLLWWGYQPGANPLWRANS